MDLLLDTQAFLWFENGDERITAAAKQSILNPKSVKFVSMASFWEIAIKNSLGKLQLSVSFEELLEISGYLHLPIGSEHLKLLRLLPYHHGDPFDRLIIAQALHENLTVISSDGQFDNYGVRRIW